VEDKKELQVDVEAGGRSSVEGNMPDIGQIR